MMIAAILRDPDGDFAYGPAVVSAVFAALIVQYFWILHRALRRGRIPFGIYTKFATSRELLWIDRSKNPVGFWSVFAFYCFGLVAFVLMIYALCSGIFVQPNYDDRPGRFRN